MPIEDRFKFWCTEGAVKPGGPSDWAICNVDQRRIITVRMDEDQDSEDVALNYFKKHAESLGPDVTQIHLAPNGDVVSLSTDPMLDTTLTIYYPSLDLIKAPKGVHVQTVLRSDLRELDRFCSNVDLVSYQTTDTTPPTTKKAVFKYYWQEQFMEQRWDELNLWLRLPSHPNIVPLDRVVLDEVRGGVVGFTTPYISGGNLEDNASRPFKLKWARQLMQVVDDLNLRYGIAHQDVVPRNLLVDEETDNIMLYDFNVSAQIGRFRGPGFLFYWYAQLFNPLSPTRVRLTTYIAVQGCSGRRQGSHLHHLRADHARLPLQTRGLAQTRCCPGAGCRVGAPPRRHARSPRFRVPHAAQRMGQRARAREAGNHVHGSARLH